MANRYWVGGTADWNGTAGTKWATTSGGAGGASVPTLSDDVFFDANSGAVTVTVTGAVASCDNLTFTGFTGTFAGASWQLDIYGNLTLANTATYTYSYLLLLKSSGSASITSNGVALSCPVTIVGSGPFTLNDDLSTSGTFTVQTGTFDTANYNMSVRSFNSNFSSTRSISLGSSIITLTGTTVTPIWNFLTTTNLTFNCGTSTIKTTGSYGASRFFSGGGQTFYNLSCENTTNRLIISADNTFNSINIGPNARLALTGGSTQVVSGFTSTATLGNIGYLSAYTGGTPAILSKSSGTVDVSYLSITDSTATGGATWGASHSTDGGGNTGWVFIDYPSISTSAVSAIDQTTATFNANLTSVGGGTVTRRGFVYSLTSHASPNITDPDVSDYEFVLDESGTFSTGTFSLNATGLDDDTTYYVRAFAENQAGFSYGSEVSLLTLSRPLSTMTSVTGISSSSATATGDVTFDGNATIIRRGFVYYKVSIATPADDTDPDTFLAKAEDTGTLSEGSFSKTLVLTWLGKAYIRSFVETSVGITYSTNEVEFANISTAGLRVYISGSPFVDRTDKVLYESFRISDYVNQQVDTCSFDCRSFKPNLNSEVAVFYEGVKIYGGVIVRVDTKFDRQTQIYSITCKDYTQYLNRRLVSERFIDKTVAEIIDELITEYATDFTMDGVEGDSVIGQITFNRMKLGDCIEALAQALNYSWYVDYDKDIHFFAKSDELAPFDLSETAGNHNWDSLKITEDFSQLKNQITVIGGEYEGDTRTEKYVADGEQKQFPLAFRYSSITSITIVGNPALTVGIDGQDDEVDYDVFWNKQSQSIRFKDSNYPDVADVVEVVGIPLYQVIVKVPDVSSIREYGLYEFKIVDTNLSSRDDAIQRGTVELEAYANSLEEGSFTTDRFGLRSGQTINVNIGGTDEDFIIQSVSMSMRTPFLGKWSVKLATVRTVGIITFLQGLLRVDTSDIAEGETLLELLSFDDTTGFTDTLDSITTRTPVYKYADAVDPAEEAKWGLSTWA